MRKPLVVGNWKMNMTHAEASAWVQAIVPRIAEASWVEVGVCPPYTALHVVLGASSGSHLILGAQDVFWAGSGAFTGSVSATMLRESGVRLAIVGHSETRGRFGKLEVPESTLGYFGETDETVNLKIKALEAQGIAPVLCVGETLAEREAGNTDGVIADQLRKGLAGVSFNNGVVAYEPVWAIGTGKVCDAEEADRVCGMIRSTLAGILGEDAAGATRILYGGSVKASNSTELFGKPDIDGGLVGGASLVADEFAQIVLSA